MSKNYLPTRGNYNDLKPFKFWCQKVLPLVYDDSLSYYELLDKVVDYLNKTMEDVTTLNDDVTAMYGAYEQLQSYVNSYFDNLDVQAQINMKLDQMAIDGSLSALIDPRIPGAVSAWLRDNVDPVGSAVVVDSTLTISGAAADAKVTGDNFTNLKADYNQLDGRLYDSLVTSGTVKTIIDGEWVQNRAIINNENKLVEMVSDTFCHSGFLNIGRNAILNVASGYQVFAWDGAYTEFGHTVHQATSSWSTGTINYTYDDRYPYLMICVMKTDSSALTPADVYSAVNISYDEESVFATKSYVNEQIGFIESHAPFTNAEASGYIKELYFANASFDVSTIDRVRIFNGASNYYGASFYNGSSLVASILLPVVPTDVAYSSNNNLYAVFANLSELGETYKDFYTTVNNNVKNVTLSPTIYAYIKSQKDTDTINTRLGTLFSNTELYKYIKELYFANASFDVSTIDRVRIFNGASNYYGASFYNGSSLVASILLPVVPTDVAYSSNNNLYAVFANLSELGETYKDFYTTVNNNVKNVTLSPTIYAYIKSKDTDTINTRLGTLFSNTELYKYIKELYFANASFDVSTIDRVRIFNGALNYYGASFYNGSSLVASILLPVVPTDVAYKNNNDVYAVFTNLSELGETYKDFNSSVSTSTKNIETSPTIYAFIKSKITNEEIALITQPVPTKGQIIYECDTKNNSGYIVNAVSYSDGVIIACRADGKVVRIGYTETEETLLAISGTAPFDWRGCFIDSDENVYVSPHASLGSMSASDRGLYRLAKGGSSFTKVISLYDSSSTTPTEAENNNDTIWTMCEDDSGNLYAGVYAHTIRANPAIYKSTDGGTTWTYLYNFKTAGDTPDGMHIHSIIWNKWQKALYVIVGEVNTVFRSADGGVTWDNLNVTLKVKGSAMLATPYGVLIGSDGAYNCEIDLLENDNVTHVNVFKGWANTVFAIRRSDVTGMLYAFTKIDSSVNSTSYYPPVGALNDPDVIDEWHTTVGDVIYNNWKTYHDSVVDKYPDDAIRPQHYAILVSRDGGRNWEVLYAFSTSSQAANGCWTTGYFNNGECLTGRIVNGQATNPVVISEGKHKYVAGGCDLSGEIFVRTNTASTVEII